MCIFTPPTELHVPATERGPWVARQFVRGALCAHHAADVDLEVGMVATELVRDSLRNSGSPVTLSLECWGSSMLLRVSDHVTRVAREDDPRSRLGRLLVEKLTVDRGYEPGPEGRTCWCLVPTEEEPAHGSVTSTAGLITSLW
jgi:hypothetical protein